MPLFCERVHGSTYAVPCDQAMGMGYWPMRPIYEGSNVRPSRSDQVGSTDTASEYSKSAQEFFDEYRVPYTYGATMRNRVGFFRTHQALARSPTSSS